MWKDHEMNDDPWGNGQNRSYFFTKKWEPPTLQLPWWCYIENEQTNWERNCLIERPTWREFFERERLQEKAWISSQVIERPPIIMIHRLTVKFVWNQLVCVSFLVGVDWFCAVLFEGSSPLKKYLNFGLSWQETIGPHFPMNCSKIGHPYLFGQNVFICLHSANKNSSADLWKFRSHEKICINPWLWWLIGLPIIFFNRVFSIDIFSKTVFRNLSDLLWLGSKHKLSGLDNSVDIIF